MAMMSAGSGQEPREVHTVTGYGMFYPSHSAKVLAHRQAYTLTSGDIPSNMVVCHTCDNELCCNPHHLFVGTQQDNMLDMRRKGRGKNESWKLTRDIATSS